MISRFPNLILRGASISWFKVVSHWLSDAFSASASLRFLFRDTLLKIQCYWHVQGVARDRSMRMGKLWRREGNAQENDPGIDKTCFLTSQNLSWQELKTISAVITGLATATHFISAEHWLEIPGLWNWQKMET